MGFTAVASCRGVIAALVSFCGFAVRLGGILVMLHRWMVLTLSHVILSNDVVRTNSRI